MTDSDAEFEKFLQESLSSSAASYISELSRSRNSSAAHKNGRPPLEHKWNHGVSNDETSDHELEIAGQSWLKSTGPLGKSHATTLDITLPSGNYSKDSLEISKGDSQTVPSSSRLYSENKDSSASDFQDTFSSGSASINIHSTLPGLDTLQENADKERFFADLEKSRNTPLDYSELNRQLENTAKSLVTVTASTTPTVTNGDDYSEQYEEDFDSTTTQSQSVVTSHSTSTLTPTDSNSELTQSNKNNEKHDNISTNYDLNPVKMTTGKPALGATPDLEGSGSSVGSVHAVKRLLNRSSLDDAFRTSDNVASGEHTGQSAHGFSLSPIHSQILSRPKVSDPSNDLGDSTNSSLNESEKRFSLTPIYSKELTTSGKEKPLIKEKKQTRRVIDSADHFSLSPLHVNDSLVQASRVSSDAHHVETSTNKHPLTFSPVKEPAIHQQENFVDRQTKEESTQPMRSSALHQVSRVSHQVNKSLTFESPNVSRDNDFRIQARKRESEGVEECRVAKAEQHNDSFVSDLNELQSALKAAGLPQISSVDEKLTHVDTVNTGSFDIGLKTVDTPSLRAENTPLFHEKPSDILEQDPTLTVVQNTNVPSSDNVQPGSEVDKCHTDSTVLSVEQPPKTAESLQPTDAHGAKKVLREAIRAIASEELASLSRDILNRETIDSRIKTNSHSLPGDQKANDHQTASRQVTFHQSSKATPDIKDLVSDVEEMVTAASMSMSISETQRNDTGLQQELTDILNSDEYKYSERMSEHTSSSKPTSQKILTRETRTSRLRSQPQKPGPKSASKLTKSVNRTRSSESVPSRQPIQVSSRLYPGTKPPPSKPDGNKQKSTPSTRPGSRRISSDTKPISQRASNVNTVRKGVSPVVVPSVVTDSLSDEDNDDGETCDRSKLEQDESKHWKNAWQDEKAQNEHLSVQMKELKGEWEEREKVLKAKYEEEQSELKQELYTLTVKLKDLETSQDSRKLLASDRDIRHTPISREEKAVLRSDIQQQEVLLQGYQKENERLYSELTKLRKELKSSQSKLYEDNQRLRKELLNSKSEVERLPQHSDSQSSNSAHLGAARISQLEDKLERANENCSLSDKQVKQLKHTSSCLEQEVKKLTHEKQQLEARAKVLVDREEMVTLRAKHKLELSRLTQKLEWYAENQVQLDKDCELMKTKDKEITSLKDTLAALEKSKGSSGAKSRGVEARRVLQLEKQVKDLERVIQKRFPNSLSALILASNRDGGSREVTGGLSIKETTGSRIEAPPTQAYLEKRIKQLEDMLADGDKENSKKLRALQQRYNAMELTYERQLASLKEATDSKPRFKGQTEREEEKKDFQSEVVRLREENRKLRSHTSAAPGDQSSPTSVESVHVLSSDLEALKMENDHLKEKLSQLSFESAHQRVQLQGKLAESEAKLTRLEETAQEKYRRAEESHKTTVDSLLSKLAKEHSHSPVAQLTSQLASKQATILHLKEKIECLEFSESQLNDSKSREEKLTQQIKTLTEHLIEAKRHHTPEMQHFLALQAKIASLEERCAEYEDLMQDKWSKLQLPVSQKYLKEIENKWRLQLNAKDAEIENFRQELDGLMGALQVLQQGKGTRS